MAYRPSREIKGDKERLSSVQQKSKIPVRRLTPLNNNSWKGSSSKEEADKKQRILMDSTEKPLENKPPSRIPIMVARTNSKTVWDKLPKGLMAAKKRPLGRESGINLREKQGKQTGERIFRIANRATAARHSNLEPGKESTPEMRRMAKRKVTPFDVKQVSKDEKDPSTETPEAQDKSVQSLAADLSSDCTLQSDHLDDVIGQKKVSVSGGDYAYLREEVELLKGSLEMCNHREELLRRQVHAFKQGQAFKSNTETVVQSSEDGHKQKLAQLEKEHFEIVEELQQWVEDGDKENQTLEEIIEKNSDENVKLLAQISVLKKELKALAKENNTLQKELETKTTDLKSLRGQVDTLKTEVSRFKTNEVEFKSLRYETSILIGKLEVQLDTFMNESARIILEKNREPSKLSEEKSTAVEQRNDGLTALRKEKNSTTSENDKEKKELRDRKSKIIDQLNKRLVSNERKGHNYFSKG